MTTECTVVSLIFLGINVCGGGRNTFHSVPEFVVGGSVFLKRQICPHSQHNYIYTFCGSDSHFSYLHYQKYILVNQIMNEKKVEMALLLLY